MTSDLCEPPVPCNGNLSFPRLQQCVLTIGNRLLLALNQTQTFGTGPLRKTKRSGPLSKTIKL